MLSFSFRIFPTFDVPCFSFPSVLSHFIIFFMSFLFFLPFVLFPSYSSGLRFQFCLFVITLSLFSFALRHLPYFHFFVCSSTYLSYFVILLSVLLSLYSTNKLKESFYLSIIRLGKIPLSFESVSKTSMLPNPSVTSSKASIPKMKQTTDRFSIPNTAV